VVSDTLASAAGVFTTNRAQAAPVLLSKMNLERSAGRARAIVCNSGCANACTGDAGFNVSKSTAEIAARLFDCRPEEVLVASTGVIGVEMDGEKIVRTLPRLIRHLSADSFEDVAHAIMTTDTVPKVASAEITIRNRPVRVAGMTKGAGMIMPNMATTLAFVMTDAEVAPHALKDMLSESVERSYNRISIDGDTSTNDTLLLLANGASGVRPNEHDLRSFHAAIDEVLESLAIQIARDGEGARKLIAIEVEGAPDDAAAGQIARSIANSPLFKTAIAGSDPNWGRILSAAGNSGIEFDPDRVDIYLQSTLVCEAGCAAEFSESKLKRQMDESEVSVRFVIKGRSGGEARFWTCDFTEDYIRINASYRT
jgi:glutamate N-acetyltransferase/amino-acid N-acetyltransferase